MSTADEREYWFPAKRYGWGWGLPRVWQGWAVLSVFGSLLGFGLVVLAPAGHSIEFFVYVSVLVAVLIGICYAKGEPPRWRWGKRS